jgi:hypothetical protein
MQIFATPRPERGEYRVALLKLSESDDRTPASVSGIAGCRGDRSGIPAVSGPVDRTVAGWIIGTESGAIRL